MLQKVVHPKDITVDKAIDTLIKSDGNLRLTAERLDTNIADLVNLLSGSLDSIQDRFKILTLLKVNNLFNQSLLALESNLSELEPYETAKAFSTIASLLIQLMSQSVPTSNTSNINVNVVDVVMKSLPPEARDALTILMQPKAQGSE